MKAMETAIPGALILEPAVHGDARGFFFESFNERVLRGVGIDARFVQDNHSRSAHNVLRGLHYQIQQTQGKLVRVARGRVFDVAVDLRRNSPAFGRWHGVELSDENHRIVWLPPGLAHGFLVLSDSADVLYKTTDYYAPAHERSLLWNDRDVGVEWPLDGEPVVSDRDGAGTSFRSAETFAGFY